MPSPDGGTALSALLVRDVPWLCCLGALSLGALAKLLWDQYGVLRHRRLPASDLGWPILGKTPAVFRESLEEWAQGEVQGCAVKLTNFLLSTVAMVSYPVYLQHIRRAELDGQLTPSWLPSMASLLGRSSVIVLPGGRGHALHKRLRGKILASMGPRPVLAMQPRLLQLVRGTLDRLAEECARSGSTTFLEAAGSLAARASSMMVTAGLSDELQARIDGLLDTTFSGLISLPLDLGRFTAYGRAKRARRELSRILRELMDSPNLEQQNIVRDLARASEEGEALSLDEMADTVFTLLVAGRLTTADALPELLVRLSAHRDWAARVAAEPLDFRSIEEDSAALRVVRECLRARPPAGACRRVCREALDLGEHGRLPPGTPFAVLLGPAMRGLGAAFEPERWAPEAAPGELLAFGGSQPHACVGRYLALLELQVFARVLCREYDFAALEPRLEVSPRSPVALCYRDGLRITIARRGPGR